MENRIQINGVWYVREDVSNSNEIQIDITEDITYFSGCVYENDKYCWEVTVIEPHKYGKSVDIKFTDKREKPWKEENWDSIEWFRGVHNDEQESLHHLEETNLCDEGVKAFKQLLGVLINDKKWL
jgi:hypothetical protein